MISTAVAVVSVVIVGLLLGWMLASLAVHEARQLNRRPDYARIAQLERELGIGEVEELPAVPQLPAVRTPRQPCVPFERNGSWYIDTGAWEIGYGSGDEGHRRALEASMAWGDPGVSKRPGDEGHRRALEAYQRRH